MLKPIRLSDEQCLALEMYFKKIEDFQGLHVEYVEKSMLPHLLSALNLIDDGDRDPTDYEEDE